MNPGGDSAVCVNCGLAYSKERLMEILKGETGSAQPPIQQPVMRKLYLKRKFNLSGCISKVQVFLDGEVCAVFGSTGEACVPIAEGNHEIIVRVIAPNVGTTVVELEKVVFQVKDHDVFGLFYLQQTAFSGKWAFELSEMN